MIARYGTGVDIVDVDAAMWRNILVTNVPNDWCKNEVADHAMALLSSIARAIAARISGFGMRVIEPDPYMPAADITTHGATPVSFDELPEQADCLVTQAPLTANTHHLSGEEASLKQRRVSWLAIVVIDMAIALLSLIPLHLFVPSNFLINSAPPVAPALREWHGGTGEFVLSSGSQIVLDPAYANQLQDIARVFQQDLGTAMNRQLPIAISSNPGTSNFFFTLKTLDSGIGDEGYLLNINASVTINAHTSIGDFYGTRSILQTLQASLDHSSLPRGYARDYPSYHERGFMLDVGRKFVPLSTLEQYVRLMAWYKLNDFQLHFNDNALNAGNLPDWQHQYAAFRLDSPAFPGLATADGSYTEQQVKELEQIARVYAVTITPEIDTPAHSLALTQYRPNLASKQYAKDLLDLGNPATTTFVNSLWTTFLPWFSTSEVNMGMDEYDQRDADKYRQYINYYDDFLKKQGKTARMWGSLSQMPSKIQVNSDIVLEDWDNTWANSVDMAKQGFKIINANDQLLYIVR